jgi:hypothetical protein
VRWECKYHEVIKPKYHLKVFDVRLGPEHSPQRGLPHVDGPLGGPSQYHGLRPWLIIRYWVKTQPTAQMLQSHNNPSSRDRLPAFLGVLGVLGGSVLQSPEKETIKHHGVFGTGMAPGVSDCRIGWLLMTDGAVGRTGAAFASKLSTPMVARPVTRIIVASPSPSACHG